MRSLKTLIVFAVAIVGTFGMAGVVAGQALEDTTATSAPGPPPNFNVPMWDGPDVVLYDNGPLVTHPGGGAGGADASAVQTALLLSTYGFGHAISTGFRVADDFTVPAGGWLINQITFFAYQTGSTTTSTINNVNLRIWNGPPNAGGSVIWGDTTTNVLATTQWSNIYRVLDTGLTNTQRPIMADTVTVGTVLPAGTYWLDWQTGGTLSSGPWAPPISILGQTVTGNALQYDPTAAVWNPAIDTGASAQQGFPFIIEGTGATGPSIMLAKTVGTVPGVCATTSSITVDAGTTVYYCYEVTNTGDVTLTLHSLVDDVLGTLFTGLSYSLAPGASVNTVQAGLSIPYVVNTTTTNTGTWTAYNAGGPSVEATDTATVTAIPPRCPAGYEEITLLTEGFEGGFPPAGWAVLNNGGACVWTNTDPGGRGNLTGGTGLFAIADSDICGSGTTMNTELRSASMDFTGLIDPIVTYYTDYNNLTSSESADLDFSTDGGATWATLIHWNSDHFGPLQVEQAFGAGNQANVLLRWHYIAPSWDWWWEVDDVVVTACQETGGQGPAIELTKTVGTVPGVCATTDTVTVSTGTTVYYCYQVENTGDVTFNFHDLDDDQLGEILNDYPYVLAPGAFGPEVIVPDVVSGPVVNTGTWTAATAVGGYTVDDTIPYNWEDISTSGTQIALSDDSTASFPIGFNFDYYGTTYTNFWVSSNGFLSDADYGSGCCTGQPLPDTMTPNGVIAGWWEDLYPPGGGSVRYQTLGSAPNRYAIVQFTNIQHFSSGNPVTMQFKLYETTGVIEVHYQAAPSDGGTHSAGIENQDGTVGLQFYLGTSGLATPEAVRYTPTVTVEATDTDTASVQVSDPDITVTPSSLASSQMTNTVVTLPLTIGNVGASNLVWDIEEAPPIEIPASNGDFPRGKAAPSFGPAPEEAMRTAAAGQPNLALVNPGTFAFSTDASFMTHIYFDSDTPGTLNTLGPATSYFWAGDFVGGDLTKTYVIRDTNTLMTVDAATGAETTIGTLAAPPGGETYTGMAFDPSTGNVYATSCNITTSSLFTIDVTTATATRIGAITNSPCSIGIGATDAGNLYTYDLVNDSLLSINKSTGAGTIIGSIGFDANYGQGMDFDSVTGTMYMAAFNNATFLPEFRAVDLNTGNTVLLGVLGNPAALSQLGYVAFQSGGPCSSPSDLPWLSVNPTSGTTIPGGTSPVDVTFDSTGIAVGTYDGVLCVNSNDPDEPIVEVPVQMEVVIPVELMGISVE